MRRRKLGLHVYSLCSMSVKGGSRGCTLSPLLFVCLCLSLTVSLSLSLLLVLISLSELEWSAYCLGLETPCDQAGPCSCLHVVGSILNHVTHTLGYCQTWAPTRLHLAGAFPSEVVSSSSES